MNAAAAAAAPQKRHTHPKSLARRTIPSSLPRSARPPWARSHPERPPPPLSSLLPWEASYGQNMRPGSGQKRAPGGGGSQGPKNRQGGTDCSPAPHLNMLRRRSPPARPSASSAAFRHRSRGRFASSWRPPAGGGTRRRLRGRRRAGEGGRLRRQTRLERPATFFGRCRRPLPASSSPSSLRAASHIQAVAAAPGSQRSSSMTGAPNSNEPVSSPPFPTRPSQRTNTEPSAA